MTPIRRLPTGVLVLVAAVLLGAGAAWWTDSAPQAARPPALTGDFVIIQFDNGALLAYDAGNSGSVGFTSRQFDRLEAVIDTQWPCRVEQPGARSLDLRRGFDAFPTDGTRVLQLPRCAESLSAGLLNGD